MIINVDKSDIRIDKYIASVTDFSRAYVSKLISDDKIKLNDRSVKSSFLVNEGDIINIENEKLEEKDITAENIDLDIVYEDEYLMIINKKSGMVVHPGAGNYNHTLVNALKYYTDNLSDIDDFRPGIVHRIDKDTSGLMVVAKDNKTHELLSLMFSKKEVHRKYIALLKGEFKYDTADIDAPIGRDKNNRQKMTITDDHSRSAVTHLRVIKRYKNFTLASLELETGRTHQIRVHMAYIGYPIYNDPVYTNDTCTSFGQFLHSSSIDFIHPITKKNMHFECELPSEFSNFLSTLEEK